MQTLEVYNPAQPSIEFIPLVFLDNHLANIKEIYKGEAKMKIRNLFAILLLIAVLVTACAPAATEEPSEPPVAEEPAAAEEVEEVAEVEEAGPFSEGCWDFPTEDVTIEIWWHNYDPFTAYVYELIDRYEEMHPNVTIEPLVASSTDVNQKLTVALASGTGPDIIDQDISFFAQYYDKGALEPINLDVFCASEQSDLEEAYIGSVLEGVTFDGTMYGLPYQTNSMSYVVSTKAFEEVGLDPVNDLPVTWDDLKRIGELLMKTENGVTVRKGYDFPYQSQRWQLQAFQPMVEQFGGTLLNEDQTKCLLNSEAAVNALTLWKDVTAVTGDPNTTLTTATDPNRDFVDGRVAIWYTGPWATNQLLASELEDNWVVSSMAQLDPNDPHTMMYGFTWGVNKAKPDLNKMVAWDFIRYMLSNPEEWLQKASFIQPRVGLLDTETAKVFPYIDVHLGDVETASWYLRSVYTNEVVQIVGRAIERTIFQDIDPKTSLDQAQVECTNMLAGQ